LIIGLERSAIGTVVERTTRFTMLVHLPREEGYRHRHSVKNGPALAGYGAVTMTNALTATMGSLPAELARSLTWDRGKEMSAHAKFKPDFHRCACVVNVLACQGLAVGGFGALTGG
jgi:IS30 family transposase